LAGGFGAAGDLYIAGGQANAVFELESATGSVVGHFVIPAGGGLSTPVGVAWGPNGNLFVGSYANDRVLQYDGNTGAFMSIFATGGGLDGPYGIAFGPDGNLYVCSFLNHRIIRYDGTSGALIGTFVAAGSGGLNLPMDLTFGPSGNLFVSSFSTHNVIQFNGTTGALVGTFASGGTLSGPAGLVFGPGGNLFVNSYNNDRVIQFDGTSGIAIGTFASGGGLDAPFGLAFGPDGHLYVSGYNSDSIVRFNGTNGTLMGVFAGGIDKASYLRFKPGSGSFPPPDVTGFSPNQAENCGVVQATIAGTGFVGGLQLLLKQAGQPDVGGSITTLSPTQLTADFNLAGVALGVWDIEARYPDNQSDVLAGVLEITQCPQPNVTGISPNSTDNCALLSGATITGSNFLTGAMVKLVMSGQPDIVGTNGVVGGGGTTVTADFPTTNAPPGFWDVVVTNPGGSGTGTLAAALQISACPPLAVTGFSHSTTTPCEDNPLVTTITGQGFVSGMTVKLQRAGLSDIVGTSIDVQSGTSLTASFYFNDDELGAWDLFASRPNDGQTATLPAAVQVIECPPQVISITPNVGCTRNASALFSITATRVNPGTTARLERIGEPTIPGVIVSEEFGVGSNPFRVGFDLTSAATGTWDVVVTYGGGFEARLTNALTLGECGTVGDLYVHTAIGFQEVLSEYDVTTGALKGDFTGTRPTNGEFLGGFPLHTGIKAMIFGGPSNNLFVSASLFVSDEPALVELDGRTGRFIRVLQWYEPTLLNGALKPQALTIAPDGRLFVGFGGTGADSFVHIAVYNVATGNLMGPFGPTGLAGVADLAIGPNGNLFVLDTNHIVGPGGSVLELDGSSGAVVRTFVGGGLIRPYSLAFSPFSGNLLVADRVGVQPSVGAVLQFDGESGATLAPFVAAGSGGLGEPADLTFLPNGRLAVVDENNSVREYDGLTGAYLRNYAGAARKFALKPDLGPYSAPLITSVLPIEPVAPANCGWSSLQIAGDGLVAGAQIKLVRAGESEIEGRLWEVQAPTVLKANFNLVGATPGAWDVVVSYPDGQSETLSSGLFIAACGGPTVTGLSVSTVENCGPIYKATISGSGLVEGTIAKLTKAGSPDVAGQWVPSAPPHDCCGFAATDSMDFDFPISGVSPGVWDLVVTNPLGQSATLAGALTIALCPRDYTFFDLWGRFGAISGDGSGSTDINDVGTVCGTIARPSDDYFFHARVWTWADGVLNVIAAPAGIAGKATAIAANDVVVGSHFPNNALDGQTRAPARFVGNDVVPMPVEPFCQGQSGWSVTASDIQSVSANGRYVLGVQREGGSVCPLHRAMMWDLISGTMSPVPLPPELSSEDWQFDGYETRPRIVDADGNMALQYESIAVPNTNRSFLYSPSTGQYTEIRPPNATDVQVRSLNNVGMINGRANGAPNVPSGNYYGFSYFRGAYNWIPTQSIRVINDHGDGVGTWNDLNFRYALLYSGGQLSDLHYPYIAPATGGGWRSSSAKSINNRGWITGTTDAIVSGWCRANRSFVTYSWLLVPNLRGDMNDDHAVDGLDIQPFVQSLLGQTPGLGFETRGDMDRGGTFDSSDLPFFVEALLDPPDGTGACCMQDGGCADAFPARLCANLGGVYRGDGTTCPCETGACCIDASQTCVEGNAAVCAGSGGNYQGDGTSCATTVCAFGRYQNDVSPIQYALPSGDGLTIADDMTLAGTGARELEYLDLAVYGNGGGPFDVFVELYDGCPFTGVAIPGSQFAWTAVPDGGGRLLIVDPVPPGIILTDTVWMAVIFSTPEAAWIIAGQAEVGSTQDVFGTFAAPPDYCNAYFGGTPYAGFWASLWCVAAGTPHAARAGADAEPPVRFVEHKGKQYRVMTQMRPLEGASKPKPVTIQPRK